MNFDDIDVMTEAECAALADRIEADPHKRRPTFLLVRLLATVNQLRGELAAKQQPRTRVFTSRWHTPSAGDSRLCCYCSGAIDEGPCPGRLQ